MLIQKYRIYLPKKEEMNEELRLVNDINNRKKLVGLTNEKLAELIGTNPAQVSLFLRGKGMLSGEGLQKCLDVLGIDTGIYTRRFELASNAADCLRGKYKLSQIAAMSRDEMAEVTGKQQIRQLLDVDKKTFEKIREVGIVDFESTYPFFRSMVIQLVETCGKTSTVSVTNSWGSIAKEMLPIIGTAAAMGILAATSFFKIGSISAFGTQKMFTHGLSCGVDALVDLTKNILNHKK